MMKTVRVPLQLTPEAAERLDKLQADTDSESRSAVIRQALQLYEWAVWETKKGNRFYKGRSHKAASEIPITEVMLFKWG